MQMDLKIDGLPYEIMLQAFEQARQGRIHILGKMAEAMSEPREELKPHAPRIKLFVDREFIGDYWYRWQSNSRNATRNRRDYQHRRKR